MRSKLVLAVFFLAFSLPGLAQVHYAASKPGIDASVGAGMDYWNTDWGSNWKYGPAAWGTINLWKGFGLTIEGHGLIGGPLPAYKYFSGDGGVIYTYRRWQHYKPYAKVEAGYGSLSFPRYSAAYSHDTRGTWAVGAGLERQIYGHVWSRADYTYEGYTDFLSIRTHQTHTLNPAGFTFGASWHFR